MDKRPPRHADVRAHPAFNAIVDIKIFTLVKQGKLRVTRQKMRLELVRTDADAFSAIDAGVIPQRHDGILVLNHNRVDIRGYGKLRMIGGCAPHGAAQDELVMFADLYIPFAEYMRYGRADSHPHVRPHVIAVNERYEFMNGGGSLFKERYDRIAIFRCYHQRPPDCLPG